MATTQTRRSTPRARAPVDAKHPRSIVAGPYGHPVHPILVTIPIGAWVCSLLFDIGSRVAEEPEHFSHGSYWLIAIGIVGALAAAVFGLLDLLTVPRGSGAWRTGLLHMGLNVATVVLFAVAFVWRYGERPEPGEVSIAQMALSVVALALLGASGYLGGKLAYHDGVRVADEGTQAAALFPRDGRDGHDVPRT